MEETVMICNNEVQVKEWDGKRVVTFADIDKVHNRPSGTARKRFNDNKKHFIKDVDYFVRKTDEARQAYGIIAPNGLVLITESGYLMIVKSFKDDLAWKVQRELVNTYFKAREFTEASHDLVVSGEEVTNLKELTIQVQTCARLFQQITDYLTINSRQQQIILQAGKDRINYLLGGAHSTRYKEQSRMYFKNMWQQFGKRFQCGTYKDLNPAYMNDAYEWISKWKYE